MKIVNWCNDNQGFVTAIFSFCSLFISFVAISISIGTIKFQSNKKLSFHGEPIESIDKENVGLDILIVNNSNRYIKLIDICVKPIDDKYYIESEYLLDRNDSRLSPQSSMRVKMGIEKIDMIEKYYDELNLNKMITIVCHDTDNKKYIGKNCFSCG